MKLFVYLAEKFDFKIEVQFEKVQTVVNKEDSKGRLIE